MDILVDTNFWLIPWQFKVDIFREFERICDFPYKVVVLDKSIDELKKIIEEQKGDNKKAAEFALQLTEKAKVLKTNSNKNTDDTIVEIADNNTIVATQDKLLKEKLMKRGIKLIILRGKDHLERI